MASRASTRTTVQNSYKESDITYENGPYFVLKTKKGFEIYRNGVTAATGLGEAYGDLSLAKARVDYWVKFPPKSHQKMNPMFDGTHLSGAQIAKAKSIIRRHAGADDDVWRDAIVYEMGVSRGAANELISWIERGGGTPGVKYHTTVLFSVGSSDFKTLEKAKKYAQEAADEEGNSVTVTKTTTKSPKLGGRSEQMEEDIVVHPRKGNPDRMTGKQFYDFGYTKGQQDRQYADVGGSIDPDIKSKEGFEFIFERAVMNQQAVKKNEVAFLLKFRQGYFDAYARRSKKKQNPESSAADMFESFHGEPSEELLEFQEDLHVHDNLAALGVLVEIRVSPVTGGKDVNICFDGADGLELENNPILWPWAGKKWIPYKTFNTEMPAQKLLGKLGDKGIIARVDRVRVKLLPTPKYKYEVLVHRDTMADLVSKPGTEFSVAANPLDGSKVMPPKFLDVRLNLYEVPPNDNHGPGTYTFPNYAQTKPAHKGSQVLEEYKTTGGRVLVKVRPTTMGLGMGQYLWGWVDKKYIVSAASFKKHHGEAPKVLENPRKKRGPIGQATRLVGDVTGTLSKPVDAFMGQAGKVGEYLDGLMANPADRYRLEQVDGKFPFAIFDNLTSIKLPDWKFKDEKDAKEYLEILNNKDRRKRHKHNPGSTELSSLTFLCSNEAGTQLHIIGGDQSLDLSALKITGPAADKEFITIGPVTHITYHTRKTFDGKPEEFDYIHKMGEKGGVPPDLIYDRINKRLKLSGGTYHINKPLWGTSPGIEQ